MDFDHANTLLMGNYARRPICMQRGEGTRLFDDTGREYLDLFAGFGGAVLGHCHPDLVRAVREQSETLWTVGNTFHTEPQLRVAEHLKSKAFDGRAFFCHGGLDANETAVKLARRRGSAKGRYKVVTFNQSFHGRSLAMIAAGSTEAHRVGFGPPVPGFVHATGGDFDDLVRHVDDETCSIMFEPLRGEGGMLGYPDDFPAQVRDFCTERDITLHFDEVWVGGGRTGKWFGHQHFDGDVKPDVMTLGKAVGGGLPVGICWAEPEHAEHLVPGTHGSTLGGNPMCMAVCATIFDVIERDGLLDHATRLGDLAKAKLRDALPDCDVRGDGLFLGIELPADPTKDLVAAGLEAGVVMNVTQKNVVRLAPAMVISEDDWARGLDLVIDVIHA
ncbi:MAG: aminotransferase class III-fold pyridoxal phosphate-dependent enzyme [Planctomycetota bacterium]